MGILSVRFLFIFVLAQLGLTVCSYLAFSLSLSLIVRRIFHPLKFFLNLLYGQRSRNSTIFPLFSLFLSVTFLSIRASLLPFSYYCFLCLCLCLRMHAHFTEFNNKNHNITMMCAPEKIVCVLSAGIDECILITNGDVIIIIICLYQFF